MMVHKTDQNITKFDKYKENTVQHLFDRAQKRHEHC